VTPNKAMKRTRLPLSFFYSKNGRRLNGAPLISGRQASSLATRYCSSLDLKD
jgi:hypothetical protein